MPTHGLYHGSLLHIPTPGLYNYTVHIPGVGLHHKYPRLVQREVTIIPPPYTTEEVHIP